jgi:hypothetical protein
VRIKMNNERELVDTQIALKYLNQNCSCDLEVNYKCPECCISETIEKLKAENEKLRELIDDAIEIQATTYGNGIFTHLEINRWAGQTKEKLKEMEEWLF